MPKWTRRTRLWMAVLLLPLGLTNNLEAACDESPASTQTPETLDLGLGTTLTVDAQEPLSLYLEPAAPRSIPNPKAFYLKLVRAGPTLQTGNWHGPLILAAPAEQGPPVRLASFAYPEVTGLAGHASDERAIPLGNTSVLAMGPGGFGRVMSGQPLSGTPNWTHAGETAISYIRPHVNVQMMLSLELPGRQQAGRFEGPGLAPRAYLAVDHRTRVDSAEIGSSTEQFGRRVVPTPSGEPQTAVAAGLDLGLLPTFLAQMGINLSVVVSRGQESGDLSLALVGTTELPVDLPPRERPYRYPISQIRTVNALRAPERYSGGVGGGLRGGAGIPLFEGGGGGGRGEPTPIFPEGGGGGGGPTPVTPGGDGVIPEPSTLILLGAGLAAILRPRHRGHH